MTAEIAVMNRQGVALAADSAVTFQGRRGPKIFSSADKIFALSKHEPIGVMIYGDAAINGVPWETVVKYYREQLGGRRFDHVEEYAEHFLGFLASNTTLFNESQKEDFILQHAAALFGHIQARMVRAVDDAIEASDAQLTFRDARRISLRVIGDAHRDYTRLDDRPDLPDGIADAIRERYGSVIASAKTYVFEEFGLPPGASRKLTDTFIAEMTKTPMKGDSGVVFAGFGAEDVFPRLVAYEVDGVVLDHTIFWETSRMTVTHRDGVFVHGFAQADVIHLFMEGVTEEYEEFVEGYVSRVIKSYGDMVLTGLGSDSEDLRQALRAAERQINEGLQRDFFEQRRTLYIDPVLDVVASLPKDELGMMAESLVNLTSLKRRISMEHETVGGPVDVAVITKGDGLVWTKRKHYFDAALNHHFFSNYFRGGADGTA